MEISDREKDRLGRDLHDGLCQKLAGIAALSTALSRRLEPHSESGSAAAEIASLLKQTIIEARNLARGLNPVNLNGNGLIGALDSFAANTPAMFAIPCTFRCNRSSLWLGEDVETHLYRIAQESVQNAVSHGRAGRISLAWSLMKSRGTLVIRDNGTGIKAELYQAASTICHEAVHRADSVPDLRNLQKQTDADYWRTWITSSAQGKLMPAFAIEQYPTGKQVFAQKHGIK